tara:strand:+ start:682 stop:1422 length:741 start_codon:yes stop_codon:yes gene_type:complete
MKFDLVIQGPLNTTSLEKINDISDQFENIIVSHWDCDKIEHKLNLPDNTIIISQPLPDREKTYGVMKDSTFYYSICSTFFGIQSCTSQYTIKMRSDEIYSDFNVLKEKLLEDDERFVFGNIFAKRWSHSPYHIGDHLFAAKTEHLYEGYKFLYDSYTYGKNLMSDSWLIQGFPQNQTAESILAKSFLKAKNIDMKSWRRKETMQKNFDIVDINKLGDYVARWVQGGETYKPDTNQYRCSVNSLGDF